LKNEKKIILGIDPGLNNTGWAIIEILNDTKIHLANGFINTNKNLPMPKRLENIFLNIRKIILKFSPNYAAVESVFVNNNAKSSLLLGQARGVIMLALAKEKIKVGEYSPNEVKKNIAGYGHATKSEIFKMIQLIFPELKVENEDSSDALAVALCHAFNINFSLKIKQ
tara:strand:+ start:1534 stop:2037 length:504 start_codon:yes stop_codon:yes gene_type:complete